MAMEQDAATDPKGKKASKKDQDNTSSDEEKEKDKSKDKDKKEKPVEVKIDLDGIQNRIVALSPEPAVIRTSAAGKGFLYYSTVAVQGLDGPLPGEGTAVHAYDLKERKEKTLIDGVERFALPSTD